MTFSAEIKSSKVPGFSFSRDGRFFGLSWRSGWMITDSTGVVIHRRWRVPWDEYSGSDGFFNAGDRFWFFEPGDKPGKDDQLIVFNPASGDFIARTAVENQVGYVGIYRGADPQSVLIECACGQDGCDMFLARRDGSELTIASFPFVDRTFSGGIAPAGTEFVTGAHAGESLRVHSLPDGRVIATLDEADAFAGDPLVGEDADQIGYEANYLDVHYIMARTRSGRLLVVDRSTMRVLGTVRPPGQKLRGFDTRGRETDHVADIAPYSTSLVAFQIENPAEVLTQCEGGMVSLINLAQIVARG